MVVTVGWTLNSGIDESPLANHVCGIHGFEQSIPPYSEHARLRAPHPTKVRYQQVV